MSKLEKNISDPKPISKTAPKSQNGSKGLKNYKLENQKTKRLQNESDQCI